MFERNVLTVLCIIVVLGVLSCKRDIYNVDITGIDAGVELKRLEVDLLSVNPGEITERISYVKEKYGDFLQLFSYVINIGNISDSMWSENLVRFCTDKLIFEVYENTMLVYPEVEDIEDALENAFIHYRYYFPEKSIPGVFTFISGFNNSIITGDSVLGIGLDRYLGADSKFYSQLGIYNYQATKMTSEYIIPDCMYAWATSEWNYQDMKYDQDNVLSEILHEGKLIYFVKCMMPKTDNELIFGFTDDQMSFCLNNEDQMWEYLIEHDLLFSTDQLIIRKLTGEAPFTSYFTGESPGRAAVWIGFRIIESFMSRNSNISLEELMKLNDINDILGRARYSPQ